MSKCPGFRRFSLFARMLLSVASIVFLAVANVAGPVHAAGTTWLVTSPSDDGNDGNLAAHTGSLRFALNHATAGDVVSFKQFDVAADKILVHSPLIVPDGVSVERTINGPCGSYKSAVATVEADPSVYYVFTLGSGSTFRNINVGGGTNTIRIAGSNADVCAAGLGIEYGGDGNLISMPPLHTTVIVDGAHATVHRDYLNGPVVVTTRGSDSRIGNSMYGSGDSNDGVRSAAVTVLADAHGAARRVIVRDPFFRGLAGMVGSGVMGGDDVPTHANNWAKTPVITKATTSDNYSTVQVQGYANPHSIVDIFFDNQVTVAAQTPVVASINGAFKFSGRLPGKTVWVLAGSTLNDSTHPQRIGSSSQLTDPLKVVPSKAIPPRSTRTITPTPQPARPHPTSTPVRALPPPLSVHISSHSIVVGRVLTVSVRTSAGARVTVTLEIPARQAGDVADRPGDQLLRSFITQYRMVRAGIADHNGRFAARLHVTYRVAGPTRASLSVEARTSHGSARQNLTFDIRPAPAVIR